MRNYVFVWTTVTSIVVLYLSELTKPASSMAACTGNCTDSCVSEGKQSFHKVEDLKQFENCTVIIGGLKLVDFKRPSSVRVPVLPELREISGFLVIYNLIEVQYISDLFPKLSVIRGHSPLDGNFSLIIHSNPALLSIGRDLLVIKGSIYILNNPQFCHAELWKETPRHSQIIIWNNTPPNWCQDGVGKCEVYSKYSPAVTVCSGKPVTSESAWPAPRNESCHPLCVGECAGRSDAHCHVCLRFQHNGRCVSACPPSARYSIHGRRCITERECKALNSHRSDSEDTEPAHKTYILRNETCVEVCEKGYQSYREYGLLKCRLPVNETICRGRTISSISDAKSLRKCRSVSGAIEIKFSRCEKYNFNELEAALMEGMSQIKELHSLHIVRVHGIRNLSFLKSLTVIRNSHPSEKYALLIVDNASLLQLFTSDVTKRLKIYGNTVIHNNPHLCPEEVHRLRTKILNPNNTANDSLLMDSHNGNRTQCSGAFLEIKSVNTTSSAALLTWDSTEPLNGMCYSTVYYRQASGNVTRLSLTVPSEDYWDAVDVIGNNSDNRLFVINGLKPASRYAFYIQAVGEKGVLRRSEIMPFSTKEIFKLPEDGPCIVSGWPYPSVFSTNPSLKIEWALPEQSTFNKASLQFLVSGEYVKDPVKPCSLPKDLRGLKNFTSYNDTLQKYKPGTKPVPNQRQILGCCNAFAETLQSAVRSTAPEIENLQDAAETIPKDNENVLHLIEKQDKPQRSLEEVDISNHTNPKGRLSYFAVFTRAEAVVIGNLIPFGVYTIKVFLCHVPQSKHPRFTNCTYPAIGMGRASALKTADRLVGLAVAVSSDSPNSENTSILLTWEKSRETNSNTWFDMVVKNDTKQVIQSYCNDTTELKIDVPIGKYTFCVTLNSLAQRGDTKCRTTTFNRSHGWRNFWVILFCGSAAATIGAFAIRWIRRYWYRKHGPDVGLQRLLEDERVFDAQYSDLPGLEDVPF